MAILILLSLLQAEPKRLPIVVIVLAALAFIAALALVVYFYKRFKAAEKQTEDDWQSGMHALLGEKLGEKKTPSAGYESPALDDIDGVVSKPTRISAAPPVPRPSITPAARYPEKAPPGPDPAAAPVGETAKQPEPSEPEAPASRPVTDEPRRPSVDIAMGSISKPKVESQTPPSQPASKPPIAGQPPPTLSQPTQSLGSLTSQAAEPGEPAVDEKPLTGLETVPTPVPKTTEVKLPDSSKTAGLTGSDSTAQVRSARPTSLFDASRTASLEAERGSQPPAGLSGERIPYEAPNIDRLKSGQVIKREPYERPVVAPLEPRDQPPDKPVPEKAKLDQVVSRPVDPRPTREASGPVTAAAMPLKPGGAHDFPDAVVAGGLAAATAGALQSRAPHGSVLGIPAVVSSTPMRLGEPVRDSKEEGIGGLVNYGKPQDAGGGRAGLIVLGVLLLAIAVGMLIYMFVPSIHTGVNEWIAKVRGRDAESLAAADNRPRARVLPQSSGVDKNIAKAKGSVENITEPPAPLENLEIEVSLVRSVGGATENRRVPVTPSVLEWGQRGQYQFDYDGDRTTGFSAYKVVKLWSGEKEIRFTSPVLSTPAPGATEGSASRR